jgi:hypothetical protein
MNDYDFEYEEPIQIPMVHIGNGEWIPIEKVEVTNVEEDIHGHDVLSFDYLGQSMKSKIITKHY